MYMEDACTIKRTDDGKYVVAVMGKQKKSKSNEPVVMPDPKTYVANDHEELMGIISEQVCGKKMKGMEDMDEDEKFEKGFKSK